MQKDVIVTVGGQDMEMVFVGSSLLNKIILLVVGLKVKVLDVQLGVQPVEKEFVMVMKRLDVISRIIITVLKVIIFLIVMVLLSGSRKPKQ